MKYINTYSYYVFIPYINLYVYPIYTTCISKRLPGMGGGLGVVDQHQVLVEIEKLLPESARHILELQEALLNVLFREGGGGGGEGGGESPYEGQKERGRDTREDDEVADEDEDEEGEGDGGELIGLLANIEEEEEDLDLKAIDNNPIGRDSRHRFTRRLCFNSTPSLPPLATRQTN